MCPMSKNQFAVELGKLGKGKPKRLTRGERERRRNLMRELNSRKAFHGSKSNPTTVQE